MKHEITMVLEKETKGAVRYQEVGDNGLPKAIDQGAVLGSLYIRKSAILKGANPVTPPAKILVTVEAV